MPNLSHVDFVPRLVTKKSCFSTLSLTSGMPGPSFEGYESLMDRANVWLQQNPDARVISCESLVVEGVYDIGEDDWTGLDGDSWEEHRFPAYVTLLRIWITSVPRDNRARIMPCQIGFRDILPARLETNPEAIGPKYEPLSAAMNSFNHRLSTGEEILPGRPISIETCTCRFTTKNCGLDPDRTFWMTVRKIDVHCYQFFRLFYIQTRHTPRYEIGFTDFTPHYTGNTKRMKVVKSEHFVHLTRRAEQWFQTPHAKNKTLLNVQTLDHNMYYKCVRDAIGYEKRVLDNPHCVHVYGQSIYHTKILRLYYINSTSGASNNLSHCTPGGATTPATSISASCPSSRAGSSASDLDTTPPSPTCSSPSTTSSNVGLGSRGAHILHKTFHISHPVSPSGVRINGDQGALFPNLYMDDVMSRVRRWIVMKGVKVTGVETVRLATSHSKDTVSAEDTHFESHGHRGACIVYAVRLYVDDDCGSLSKKDLNPEPKTVKLTDHHCTVL